MSEVEGVVMGHRDGHGFVVIGDRGSDIYLAAQEMATVMHRDRVRVRVVRHDRKGRPEGRVLDILERRRVPILGRLLLEGGVWIVAPEDKRYAQDILIPKNGINNGQAGQVVAVELTEPPSMFAQPVGRVTEVLGDIDDPGMEIEIAVRKFEVPHQFSDEALAQAAALPETLRAVDRKHRIDLRDVPFVTIDGEDARDFDDAVYCEPVKVGRGKSAVEGHRLLVAIADVSHYVKPGEPLDVDAYTRATSVYFPRRVIPMLPEKLSNGLCSLNPEVERLAMVCDMVITPDGSIHAYQFYPAVFTSFARLTYDQVAGMLGNTHGPEARRRGDLLPHLLNLHDVFRARLRERARRGAIDFDTTETQIICDDNGRIERIVPRTRNDAHRLIEEAMLAANVCSAEFIAQAGHPSLYRVHEGPTPEKRIALQAQLRALGIGMNVSDEPTPHEMQAIALAVRDRPDAAQIQMLLLRSMQQAIYTSVNAGHFGLAFEAYTHFTSPIRRYPDLLVHRTLKAILGGKRYAIERGLPAQPEPAPNPRKGGRTVKPQGQEAQAWEGAGLHCSVNERRADDASRDVEAWLKTRYMRDHLGESFAGTVTTATSFGLFVQLDALYVEGLVHITELGGEYYKFDEVRQELRGERTGVRYGAGTRLQVQVSRVDLDARRIDFRLVRDEADARPAARGNGREKRGRDKSPRESVEAATETPTQRLAGVQEADAEVRTRKRAVRADAHLRVRPLDESRVARRGKKSGGGRGTAGVAVGAKKSVRKRR